MRQRRDGGDGVIVVDPANPAFWGGGSGDASARERRLTARRRRRRGRRAVTLVVVLVATVLLVRALAGTSSGVTVASDGAPSMPAGAGPRVGTAPPTTFEMSTSTGPPSSATATTYPAPPGNYRFLQQNSDETPQRWDPCRPIRYETHLDGAPPGALEFIQEGLRRLSAVTGLQFVYVGETSRIEQMEDRDHVDQPVWIGFVHMSDTDIFAGDSEAKVAGRGGFDGMVRLTDGRAGPTSGEVALVLPVYAPLQYGPGWSYGNAFLHELGHLVGLDHAPAAGDLMNVTDGAARPDGYGPGDLVGLQQLGMAAGCTAARVK